MQNQYKVRQFKCLGCGKEVEARRATNKMKYCSLACYRKSNRPQSKTGKYVSCGVCGKELYRPKARMRMHRHYFCSVRCADQGQRKNKLQFTCKTCGKEFRWSPSRVSKHNPTYCSIKCRTACPDWRRNAIIKSNLVQQNNKQPNKLEVAGSKLLDTLGIKYLTQVLICEKFVVDVFIPKFNIVIQWDGDYWHGYLAIKDARQRKRCNLDKSQDAYMKKVGYTVIRFWEHDVKDAKDVVIKKIKATLATQAQQISSNDFADLII